MKLISDYKQCSPGIPMGSDTYWCMNQASISKNPGILHHEVVQCGHTLTEEARMCDHELTSTCQCRNEFMCSHLTMRYSYR